MSKLEWLQKQPLEFRIKFLSQFSDDEKLDLHYDIKFWGRLKQQMPPGDWFVWFICSGRGFGKTKLASGHINDWAHTTGSIALVGTNYGEARDVMVEGESGILANAHPNFYPTWNRSLGQLDYPNGCRAQIYSAEDPDSLRGPNNGKAWVDELAKMRYQREMWDELEMTMRSGANPQIIVTSTPQNTPLIKQLKNDPTTIVTVGSSYENINNLSPRYVKKVLDKHKGTRRGRQEIYGEILDDNPDAMFTHKMYETTRVGKTHTLITNGVATEVDLWTTMDRIVISVDPATTSNASSDETGIMVCGIKGEHGYTFEDATMKGKPNEWAKVVVDLYHKYKADRVVAETNQGGDMVETIIRTIDKNISFKSVHVHVGKKLRAEPIQSLFEQQRLHHVGYLPELENEANEFNPTLSSQASPNRLDAEVGGFTELFDINYEPEIEPFVSFI